MEQNKQYFRCLMLFLFSHEEKRKPEKKYVRCIENMP